MEGPWSLDAPVKRNCRTDLVQMLLVQSWPDNCDVRFPDPQLQACAAHSLELLRGSGGAGGMQ